MFTHCPAISSVSAAQARTRTVFGQLCGILDNPALAFLCFFALTLVAYAPALQGELLWDDIHLVSDNPLIRSPILCFEIFRHGLFVDLVTAYYRPVQNLTYMVDYWLWNQNPFGYHLTNIAYHALAGFLLYQLVRSLLPTLTATGEIEDRLRRYLPLGVALIWVAHPIHNAGVAYISGRADSLTAVFALGGWIVCGRALRTQDLRKKSALFASACVLGVLALGSKEIAIAWLALLLLYTWCFHRPLCWKQSAGITFGLLAVVAAYLFLRHLPPQQPPVLPGPAQPWAFRILLMLRAMGDYTWLLFYPDVLRMERIVFDTSGGGWFANSRLEYLSLIGAAALVAGVLFCLHRSPGRKLRVFGVCWWLTGFLPVSNLFPLNAQVAEHWIYMPSAGFFVFAAGCLPLLPPRGLRIAAAMTALFLAGLTARTAMRAADWSDPVLFYAKTIADGSRSSRILMNLSTAYFSRGDYAAAEQIARRVVAWYPASGGARVNLGSILLKRGKKEEADHLLKLDDGTERNSTTTYGYTWMAYTGRANERFEEGKPAEALHILNEAITKFPDVYPVIQSKARILQETAGPAAAIPAMADYTRRYWWRYEPWLTLGRLQSATGNYDAAIATFQHCSQLDIHAAEPFSLIAQVEVARGNLASALRSQRKAVRQAGSEFRQFLRLAEIYDRLGDSAHAAAARAEAEAITRNAHPF